MAYFERLLQMSKAPVGRTRSSPLVARADVAPEWTEGDALAGTTGVESTAVDAGTGSLQNTGEGPKTVEPVSGGSSGGRAGEQEGRVLPPTPVSEVELTTENRPSDTGPLSFVEDALVLPRTGSVHGVSFREVGDADANIEQKDPTVVIPEDAGPAFVPPSSDSVKQKSGPTDAWEQPGNVRHMQSSAKFAKPEALPGDAKTKVGISPESGVQSPPAPPDSMETALRSVRRWLAEPGATRDVAVSDSPPADIPTDSLGGAPDRSGTQQYPGAVKERGKLPVRRTPFHVRQAEVKPRGKGTVLSIGTINVTVEAATPESATVRKPAERPVRPVVSEVPSAGRGTHLGLLRHYLRL